MSKRSRPKRAARRTVRQWLGELSTGVKAAGGLAVAIAAIVGLVFLFFPDWAPDPTPDEGSAEFSEPTLEHPVSYGQYLDRVEIPRDTSTPEELAHVGAIAGVQLTAKGYKDDGLPLRWYLLDETTHEIVGQQSKRHVFTPDRNDAGFSWPVWVPLPDSPGPFRVVLQIYPPGAKPGEPGIVPLDEVRTETFPAGEGG